MLPMMVVRWVLERGWSWVSWVVTVWLSEASVVVVGGGDGLFVEESGFGLDGCCVWLASAIFIGSER